MFDHMLVPLDGSPLAECVLPHAIAIAKAFGTQITVVHVLEQPSASLRLPKADPLDWFLKKSAANQYLSAVKARLEARHLTVQIILLEGHAAEQIVELAHANKVDLLILSGYGETDIQQGSRSGVSNIVQQILQRLRTSTLIIRTIQPASAQSDDFRYQRLLVPLDGSQRAGAVLTIVNALARAHEAELLLVHIVSKPEMARHMPLSREDAELTTRLIERNQEAGRNYLELVLPHLPANTRTRQLVSDNIAVTLQNISEQEQIDLLILSAHGYSGEAKWSYGSVTNRFITDGTTPLLIVQDLPQEAPQANHAGIETRQLVHQTNGK